MSLPAAYDPAFIMNSSLCVEDDYTVKKSVQSTDSRSTSPGTSSNLPSTPEGFWPEGDSALPDYEYPLPVFVRNTFIDAGLPRPLSLEEYFEERRVHSCPVESPPGLSCDEVNMPTGPLPLTMTGGAMMDSAAAAAASASAAVAAATRCLMRGVSKGSTTPSTAACTPNSGPQLPVFNLRLADEFALGDTMTPITPPPPGLDPPILRLADALTEPILGSAQMPTVGSAGHTLGNCRPCAFYHTKGCGNGTQCSFCHICPPGEKKRRQKEKGVLCREMKRMGLVPEA